MSYGGRLVLINSVLTSLPMFLLSFFEIPVGVRKRLDFYRSRFFWQNDEARKKYRLARWDIICSPKDQGGLGIENLEVKNKCLLSKWLYRLSTESEGTWIQIIQNKYLNSKTLAQVTARPNDSSFWKGLMKIKMKFYQRVKFIVGNGASTRFWEDTWLGDTPLALQYPMLYNIVQRKEDYVSTILQSTPLNIQFRRALVGARWDAWLHLVERIMQVHLAEQSDSIRWILTKNGVFSVKSMYSHLINTGILPTSVPIWRIKVPLRIKIFMWFIHKGVILTKDNLLKRSWRGRPNCCYCEQNETIKHLFIECPLAKLLWRTIQIAFNISPPICVGSIFTTWLNGVDAKISKLIGVGICALFWAIWNTRNDMIFNGKNFNNFLQVIYRATSWIRTWSLLSHAEYRDLMDIGCNRWEMAARVIFNRFGWRANNRLDV